MNRRRKKPKPAPTPRARRKRHELVQFSVCLEQELVDRLDAYADQQGYPSRSSVMRAIARRFVATL